jgi:hypothetical protein
MRLGPKEKQILSKLISGKFTPPSVYLGDYVSCPSCLTLNRIRNKGLVEYRYETQTPEERKRLMGVLTPGREAAEYNAALRPTPQGEKIIYDLINKDCPF